MNETPAPLRYGSIDLLFGEGKQAHRREGGIRLDRAVANVTLVMIVPTQSQPRRRPVRRRSKCIGFATSVAMPGAMLSEGHTNLDRKLHVVNKVRPSFANPPSATLSHQQFQASSRSAGMLTPGNACGSVKGVPASLHMTEFS